MLIIISLSLSSIIILLHTSFISYFAYVLFCSIWHTSEAYISRFVFISSFSELILRDGLKAKLNLICDIFQIAIFGGNTKFAFFGG